MTIDMSQIADDLTKIISRFEISFYNLDRKESQLLELSALIFTAEYYRERGYLVIPKNLTSESNEFFIKIRANAKPFRYSYFEISNGDERFEIHGNLQVKGCFDENGIYVVDVAVVKHGLVPSLIKKQKDWKAIPNSGVITFLEVKKLIIYPMLLAQFVGIVHEIKNNFLEGKIPRGFKKNKHILPSLIAIGYLSGTSNNIVSGFKTRNYKILVIPNFNREISNLSRDGFIEDLNIYNA